MVKKEVISNVSNICFSSSRMVVVGNKKFTGEGIMTNINAGMRPVFSLGDKVLVQYQQFGEIDVFDLDANLYSKFDLKLNLYSHFVWNEKLIVVSRATKSYWSIDESLIAEDLLFYKHYNFQIGTWFYAFTAKNDAFTLAQHAFDNPIPNWEIEIDSKIFTNSGQIPTGNNEKVYFPFKHELVCLNVASGKQIWALEGSHSFEIDNTSLIQNRGDSIIEFDKNNGKQMRSIEYSKISKLSSFRSAGPIWIFDRFICVIDGPEGIILMIEKENFDKIELVAVGYKIPNDKNSIRMKGSKMFVLDNEDNLLILKFQNDLFSA